MIDNVASLDFLNVYLSLLVRSLRARELGLPAVGHQCRGPLSSISVRKPVRDMSGRLFASLGLHVGQGMAASPQWQASARLLNMPVKGQTGA
jgi:hypothetical protein